MDLLLSFLSICGLFGSGQAWWLFNRDTPPVLPQTGIDEDCVRAGVQGSCEIYECLQRRFPCHSHSFAQHHGLAYCLRFNQHKNIFTPEGVRWVERMQTCMSREILDFYRLPETTCRDLNRMGWDRMSSCFVRQGFCDIALDNREQLWSVLQGRDLLHTIRLWREILETVVGCGEQVVGQFEDWASAKVAAFRK